MPMRDVVLCLKDAPQETNAEILAFRRELEERTDIRPFRYSGLDALKEHLAIVCEGWARHAIASRTSA